MDTWLLFVLMVIGAFGFAVVRPKIMTGAFPAANLRDASLETAWVKLKAQILVTSPYTNEVIYTRLYRRSLEVLALLMARHQHYTMGIEAKWRERAYVETCAVFKEQERRDAASTTYYRVNPTLNFKNASDDLILYTCWFAYIGGQPAFLPGEVMPDLRFVREALDYLIKERKSVDAIFLKGFILKYGLGVHGKPNLQAAREHLDAAARAGVGSAAQELRNLDEHLVLGSVRSVHTEDYWETTALAG